MDAILDVKHDLGKYIRMPIAMLPDDATDGALKEALLQALQRTRTGPKGPRPARSIWEGFEAEVGGALRGEPVFDALAAAVARALAWEGRAAAAEPVERGSIMEDFAAVGARIQELLDEVSRV